ncbi:MAG: sigma 54-interacting transcriptional regulator, partial [Planctomycetota bacterium]|nr:sigma 54-interacting transcriptional regulator [Planctomycetota bacterium]
RVLQEFRVRRIGEDKDRPIDLRVIAATNRDLEQEVERGAFREDLLFRLDVIRLEVPALRDRRSDIRELLNHFLSLHGTTYQRATPSLNDEQWTSLASHQWPGNIRELENTARRIILLGADAALAELRRRQKPPSAAEAKTTSSTSSTDEVLPLKDVVRQATRDAIVQALRVSDGSRTQAAALLGVSRKTLFNKMQDLGIREESKWT